MENPEEMRRPLIGVQRDADPYAEHEVARLSAVVVRLLEEGKYSEALEPAETALALSEQHLGADNPGTLKSMNNLAGLYTRQGRHPEAAPLFVRALALSERVLGADHPYTLGSMNNLAGLYVRQGRYPEAENLYQRALGGRERVLGPDHPQSLTSVNNLAGLYLNQGRYSEAEPLFVRALAGRERVLGADHPQSLTAINNLAQLYAEQGRYPDAEPLLVRALEAGSRVQGSDHPHTISSMNNLALLLLRQGRYLEAEPLFERAQTASERVLGADHPQTLLLVNSLAALFSKQGRYPEAELLMERVLESRERVLGADHPQTLSSMNNLAQLYSDLGHYLEAEPLYHRALALSERILRADHPQTLSSINNLAVFYLHLGRCPEAEPLLVRGLEGRERVLGADHPDTLGSMNNLAQLYSDLGRYPEAEPLYERALEACKRVLGAEHPQTLMSLSNLGSLHAATGNTTNAFELLNLHQQAETRQILRRISTSSDELAATAIQQAEAGLHAFVSLVWQGFGRSAPHVRAALDMVLRRKAIGLEAAVSRRQMLLTGRYPHLQPHIEQLTALRTLVVRKTLEGPAEGGDSRLHLSLLRGLETKLERMERDLAHSVPELALDQKLQNVDCQVIALALPQGSVLVEFLRFHVFDFEAVSARGEQRWKTARYVAFVLQAGDPDEVRMIDLGEADFTDQMIEEFRRSLALGLDDRNFMTDGRQPLTGLTSSIGERLRRAVFDPLSLRRDDVVLLAPDGELGQLPFEALPAGDIKIPYLIDRHKISYLNTGRDLLRLQSRTDVGSRMPVVIADPAFSLNVTADGTNANWQPETRRAQLEEELKRGGCEFRPLPGTRCEGERIGKRLGVSPWYDVRALESALKREQSPMVIHAATHGFFVATEDMVFANAGFLFGTEKAFGRLEGVGMHNPMLRSGLALAGAQNFVEKLPLPAEAEDGLLTAEDAAMLDLRGTEMIVLSACDTGRGQVRNGEGVFGLQRGFVLAGVKTIVMSLQKVDDLATVLLMDRFYKNLFEPKEGRKLSRSEALRDAQRSLRREVTIQSIREEWLNDEMIERLAGGDQAARERLEYWRNCPDDYRPFRDPGYWGVFILHGETGPLDLFPTPA